MRLLQTTVRNACRLANGQNSGLTTVTAVKLPGQIQYKQGLAIQEKFSENLKKQTSNNENFGGYVLLLEHKPVYTIGLRTKQYSDVYGRLLAERTGADFVKTKRGGLITFHGPGQLVSYPILNLNKFPWLPTGLASNSCYVHALEQVVIDTLDDDFGITGERSPDTGVWLGNSKICAMGLQVKKGYTMHGIALNCSTDLNWFGNIVPCGLVGKSVTTLSEELGKTVTVGDAIPGFLKSFSRNFKCQIEIDDSVFENVLAEIQN